MGDGALMPRGQNLTREHQQNAQAARSSQSLSEAGKAGYRALVKKGKSHIAGQKAAEWRLDHPSCLEKVVIDWLDDLGINYEREKQIGKFYADFVIDMLAIEVNGAQWHELEQLRQGQKEREKGKYQTFSKLGYTILVLPECDIKSGEARIKIKNILQEN